MVVKIIPYDTDLFGEFPDSKWSCSWDGGVAYTSKKGRRFILWTDERAMLDFLDLDPELDDEWISKDLVRLYIFDSERERKEYIKTLSLIKNVNKKKPNKTSLFAKMRNIISKIMR